MDHPRARLAGTASAAVLLTVLSACSSSEPPDFIEPTTAQGQDQTPAKRPPGVKPSSRIGDVAKKLGCTDLRGTPAAQLDQEAGEVDSGICMDGAEPIAITFFTDDGARDEAIKTLERARESAGGSFEDVRVIDKGTSWIATKYPPEFAAHIQ